MSIDMKRRGFLALGGAAAAVMLGAGTAATIDFLRDSVDIVPPAAPVAPQPTTAVTPWPDVETAPKMARLPRRVVPLEVPARPVVIPPGKLTAEELLAQIPLKDIPVPMFRPDGPAPKGKKVAKANLSARMRSAPAKEPAKPAPEASEPEKPSALAAFFGRLPKPSAPAIGRSGKYERSELVVYRNAGGGKRVIPLNTRQTQRILNEAFSDWKVKGDPQHDIDPKLLDRMVRVADHLNAPHLNLVSVYRVPKRQRANFKAGRTSTGTGYHPLGMAADFTLPHNSKAELIRRNNAVYAYWFGKGWGGTKAYKPGVDETGRPTGGFVHCDVRSGGAKTWAFEERLNQELLSYTQFASLAEELHDEEPDGFLEDYFKLFGDVTDLAEAHDKYLEAKLVGNVWFA